MATSQNFKYERRGVVVHSSRRLNVGEMSAIVKAKKGATSEQVAVFDAAGNLVGTVDSVKITLLSEAPKKADPSTDHDAMPIGVANPTSQEKAPPPPTDDQGLLVKAVADSMTVALQGHLFAKGTSAEIAKSAGDVDTRYEALRQSLPRLQRDRLDNAVALGSIRLGYRRKITSAAAVRLAKTVALDVAAGRTT